ncbi:hypothetical protein J3R82DRAFT_1626 [Butyriboletus roseoflavus]|nr:hypothetical protein J3R82DRAFT_1626 [Butyriboletus roseoflavus]
MFCYFCGVAALSTIMGLVNADTEIVNESVGLYICADLRSPSFYQTYIFWVPVIGYDSILFMFALWHCIRTWVSTYRRAETRWKGSVRALTITDVLIAGNVGYFLGYVHPWTIVICDVE